MSSYKKNSDQDDNDEKDMDDEVDNIDPDDELEGVLDYNEEEGSELSTTSSSDDLGSSSLSDNMSESKDTDEDEQQQVQVENENETVPVEKEEPLYEGSKISKVCSYCCICSQAAWADLLRLLTALFGERCKKTADLPARAALMNMKQYNGKCARHLCKSEGTAFGQHNLHRCWPFEKNPEKRRHHDQIRFATKATQKNAVMGVKGHSIFAKLLYPFDLIRSFAID